MSSLVLSPKFKAFLRHQTKMEVLEGTTAAGKTTVGAYKFLCMVMASPKQMHILAAEDTGTAEKNIIQKDLGVTDLFPASLVEYHGNGSSQYKMPHLIVHTSRGDKVVFVIGYRDRTRWKDALGGQYGCLYIDEINTANMDFIRESVMRADYVMATLNPDDPDLPVYKEYINRCRPLPQWRSGTPKEILAELKEPEHPGWVHWFFSFEDNAGLSREKKEQIIGNVPEGTKLWKNKILGLRGKATGLVFPNFDRRRHTMKKADLKKRLDPKAEAPVIFDRFTSGLDTSYSAQSQDTVAMTFQGITKDGTLYILEEQVLNNAEVHEPFAPSDIAERYVEFLSRCARDWGMFRNVFVDSADQATLMELAKYKRTNPCPFIFNGSYKIPIIDRINLQLGWIETGHYIVLDHCTEHMHELDTYSYTDKGVPEDGHDHTVNSCQYGWIPYQAQIGNNRK